MRDADDGKSTYWYYRLGGSEFGPVMTNRLRQLARKGELAAEDKVRRGKLGEWVDAGTIEGLPVKPRARPLSPVAGPLPPATESNVPEYDGATLGQRLLYWYYDLLDAIVGRFWLIRRVGAILALVAVTVVLVRLTLTLDIKPADRAPARDPYATFSALCQELRDKREAEVDEDVWAELKERGNREIEPLVAALAKEASATNRTAQMLLWAGRDCLTKMFDDAREEPSRSEAKFDEYMQNVERLRKNEPIYGGNLAATHLYDHIRPVARAWYAVSNTTLTMWGVITVANIGVVIWLIRRWRKNG